MDVTALKYKYWWPYDQSKWTIYYLSKAFFTDIVLDDIDKGLDKVTQSVDY